MGHDRLTPDNPVKWSVGPRCSQADQAEQELCREIDCSSGSNVRGSVYRETLLCICRRVRAVWRGQRPGVCGQRRYGPSRQRWPSPVLLCYGGRNPSWPRPSRPRPSSSFTSLSDPRCTIGVLGNRIAVLDVDGTLSGASSTSCKYDCSSSQEYVGRASNS